MISNAKAKHAFKNIESTGESQAKGVVDLELWFDLEDKERAEKIDLSQVESLEMDENFFSVLPKLFLTINDGGTYYNDSVLNIGRKIYVCINVGPKSNDEKEAESRILRFSIERLESSISSTSRSATYEITCIYDAQAYLNKIVNYPVDAFGLPVTSAETISQVCMGAGLAFSTDTPILTDVMSYINRTLTAKKFIEKVVNHSWMGDDDAPLFFVDLDGVGNYTSLKTLCKGQPKHSFINQTRLTELLQQSDHEKVYKEILVPQSMIGYQSSQQINLGAQLNNFGGGARVVNTYDPGLLAGVALKLHGAEAVDIKNADMRAGVNQNHLKYEFEARQYMFGTKSNVESAQAMHVTENVHTGLASYDTHMLYDIAPQHNAVIRKAFFQNFWKIIIDTSKQPLYFYKNDSVPRLGQKVFVDFTTSEIENQIMTGDYIITRIQHVWSANNAYALAITIVSDGYNENKN